MRHLDNLALRVKRADTPFHRRLKSAAVKAGRMRVPLPLPWIWVIQAVHLTRLAGRVACRRLCVMLYRDPLFRQRCESVGENLYLERLPSVTGHVRISMGANVTISGSLDIVASRVCDDPELRVGDGVFLGHQVVLHPNRCIVIESDVLIANGCFITDSNEHPLNYDRRIRKEPCTPDEIRPVIIRRGAWLGRGCTVLRGVEIGEGAVVGAGSVVTKSIPPHTIVQGNPAVVVRVLRVG